MFKSTTQIVLAVVIALQALSADAAPGCKTYPVTKTSISEVLSPSPQQIQQAAFSTYDPLRERARLKLSRPARINGSAIEPELLTLFSKVWISPSSEQYVGLQAKCIVSKMGPANDSIVVVSKRSSHPKLDSYFKSCLSLVIARYRAAEKIDTDLIFALDVHGTLASVRVGEAVNKESAYHFIGLGR